MTEQICGGRAFYGEAIGILMLDMKAPLIPGNVGNASSYSFPVRYKVLSGIPSDWWCDEEGASLNRQNIFIEKARELEAEGVRAITTGCGFFAKYQKAAAQALSIPLFNSPLLMVPMVSKMIGTGKRVGIISAGGSHLKGAFLENVGIDDTILFAVDGLEDQEEFTQVHVTQEKNTIDPLKMELEVVTVAERLVGAYPDIGALVFECSDLPPYAAAVQQAVDLPIFDFMTMINMVYQGVVKKRFDGFM